MLKYKDCPTLPQGGLDIGLKDGKLAEIGYVLHECALSKIKDFWVEFVCEIVFSQFTL